MCSHFLVSDYATAGKGEFIWMFLYIWICLQKNICFSWISTDYILGFPFTWIPADISPRFVGQGVLWKPETLNDNQKKTDEPGEFEPKFEGKSDQSGAADESFECKVNRVRQEFLINILDSVLRLCPPAAAPPFFSFCPSSLSFKLTVWL